MEKVVIIYQSSDGGVSIIDPISNYPDLNHNSLTPREIAEKDVPTGKPYKIVDKSDISTDRTFRGAWIVDEVDLVDGTGK